MTFELRPRWYLVVALLLCGSLVQGDDTEPNLDGAERMKRDFLPLFGNDLRDQSQDGVSYLQNGRQNVFPYGQSSEIDAQTSSYMPRFDSKQSGDNYGLMSGPLAELEYQNSLLDPVETMPSQTYSHNFIIKRNLEVDTNDRPELDQLSDSDDDLEVIRRRVPQFSHNFIGKRPSQTTADSNFPKRIPVQLFARRAPHYTHSFVGKRSDDAEDLTDMQTANTFPERGVLASSPGSFLEEESAIQFPSDRQRFSGNYLNFRSEPSFQFSEIPFLHNVVKRASNIEIRGPNFGHSFVGKRGPNFGHSFVGKRGPSFGHSFVGKRGPSFGHSFVGKRGPSFGHSFVGKRGPSFGHSFVGKRGPRFGHSFVGKRGPRFGHSFVGKRGPSFGHSFVGKRGPSFGHSFVGKREDNVEEVFGDTLLQDKSADDISISVTPEEFSEQVDLDTDQDSPIYGVESPEKRQQQTNQNALNLLGKRPSFSHSFVGKRGPRFGHSFVGKRGPGFGHSFVGKRGPGFGHSFVGKRPGFSHSFVGKRGPGFGHSFVGKRGPGFGHSFVGKRGPGFGHSFVGKRPGFSHSFVGKRPGFSHSFVGKRGVDGDSNLSEKPVLSNEDIDLTGIESDEDSGDEPFPAEVMLEEKISNDSSLLGEVLETTDAESYRNMSPEAVESFDKTYEVIEKRAPGFGHNFVGRRAPGFGHNFVGKRAPGFGHNFVGKRAPGFGHNFVGKRAPGFGHNFVGKRAPGFGHNFVGKRAPGFGHNFVGKRAPGFGHNFVGKREDDDLIIENDLLEDSLGPDDITELEAFIEAEVSGHGQGVEGDSSKI